MTFQSRPQQETNNALRVSPDLCLPHRFKAIQQVPLFLEENISITIQLHQALRAITVVARDRKYSRIGNQAQTYPESLNIDVFCLTLLTVALKLGSLYLRVNFAERQARQLPGYPVLSRTRGSCVWLLNLPHAPSYSHLSNSGYQGTTH